MFHSYTPFLGENGLSYSNWLIYRHQISLLTLTFQRQSHKMVKHTQTIRRQFADELFECVWLFCEIGA